MSHQHILKEILSSTPYFNSHDLLVHWMSKCEVLVKGVESIVDRNDASELISSPTFRKHFAFLARGPRFKTVIKKIGRAMNRERLREKQEIESLYSKLLSILQPFSNENWSETVLQASGYDLVSSLTSPYPLLVSPIINEGENCPAESEEIIKLFSGEQSFLFRKYLIVNFSDCEMSALRSGLCDLNTLSPYLLWDVTMNVRFFARLIPEIVDTSSVHMSLTTSYLPGICFFSDGTFAEREKVSECILHEALHMKYLQTIEIYFIHTSNYTGDTGRRFYCPWRSNDNTWIFSRAFAAFHVYSHLYIYYGAFLERGLPDGYRQDWVEERRKVCNERASILQVYVEREKEEAFSFDGFKFYEKLLDAIRVS